MRASHDTRLVPSCPANRLIDITCDAAIRWRLATKKRVVEPDDPVQPPFGKSNLSNYNRGTRTVLSRASTLAGTFIPVDCPHGYVVEVVPLVCVPTFSCPVATCVLA